MKVDFWTQIEVSYGADCDAVMEVNVKAECHLDKDDSHVDIYEMLDRDGGWLYYEDLPASEQQRITLACIQQAAH